MHVSERQRKLADELAKLDNGQTVKGALQAAGYSEAVSNHGWTGVPATVIKLIAKKGIRLIELGKIDAEKQEQLVRGRLVYNTIKGKDSGVLSAKALGSDRRIAMFTPEIQAGVVVIQMPSKALDSMDKLLEEPKDE
jgi:hypothetical protein